MTDTPDPRIEREESRSAPADYPSCRHGYDLMLCGEYYSIHGPKRQGKGPDARTQSGPIKVSLADSAQSTREDRQ